MVAHLAPSLPSTDAICSTSGRPYAPTYDARRMSSRLGRRALSRTFKAACRSAAGPQVLKREYSVPPREFPASISNLDGARGVLRLAGSEVLPFLQGLLTNDVNSLQKPNAPPVYAALLNAQGRQLHDMFLFRTEDLVFLYDEIAVLITNRAAEQFWLFCRSDEPVILLDVDHEGRTELKKKLTMYKLRSDVDVADVTDEFSIWCRFGTGRLPTDEWTSDPRLDKLGQRTIRGKKDRPPSPDGEGETTPLEYQRWRVLHGVAEGDIEIPTGHAMPLEYNLDALNGISYTKGCYVGQELVARTHNRGVIRKRLMPIDIEGPAPEVGASIVPTSGGSEIGKVRHAEGGHGLAHLRLKPALEAAAGNQELTAGDGSKVVPWRPYWWPSEWGKEEDAAEAA